MKCQWHPNSIQLTNHCKSFHVISLNLTCNEMLNNSSELMFLSLLFVQRSQQPLFPMRGRGMMIMRNME